MIKLEYTRLSSIELKNYINNRVYVVFMVLNTAVKLQKDKVTKFITFNMVDGDICIDCKLFGATEEQIESIKDGVVFNAAVDVKPYDKAPSGYSCVIYNIEKSDVSPQIFVNWSDKLMISQQIIQDAVNQIANTVYGQIACKIVIDNWGKFTVWSAAKSQHHSRLGDLITHTAEVVKISSMIADYTCEYYGERFINKPLLIASAMIHDIGKLSELNVNSSTGGVEYSTDAALTTHIMSDLSIIDATCSDLGLGTQQTLSGQPEKSDEQIRSEVESILLLKHCVAAHHGKLEWGSPIKPAIPEAYILNKADEMSAEMFRYNKAFKDLEAGKSLTSWVSGELRVIYREANK